MRIRLRAALPLWRVPEGEASRDLQDPRAIDSAQASIERARHLLWHGRAGQGIEELIHFMNHVADITLRNGDEHLTTTTDLRRFCAELRGYVLNNYDAIIGYHQRYHSDRPVSISRAEGCVDEIAHGRMSKRQLPRIQAGDLARVHLMGERAIIEGHVQSLAGGIADREEQGSADLLADVNPTFSWVRLAQRVPVRIALDYVPPDIRLVSGRTATVEVLPHDASSSDVARAHP